MPVGYRKYRSLSEAFWSGVQRGAETACWVWIKSSRSTYGRLVYGGVAFSVHRLSWELHNKRKVPAGMFVCHHCDTPKCVNPHHLFIGSCQDNMLDMSHKRRGPKRTKTHCPAGHPYSGDNLYTSPQGHRRCRECFKKKREEVEARVSLLDKTLIPIPEVCRRGHLLEEVGHRIDPRGSVICVECARENLRKWKASRGLQKIV